MLVQPPLRRRMMRRSPVARRCRRPVPIRTRKVEGALVPRSASPAGCRLLSRGVYVAGVGGPVAALLFGRCAATAPSCIRLAAAGLMAVVGPLHGSPPGPQRLLPLGTPTQVHVQHLLVVVQRLLRSCTACVWDHTHRALLLAGAARAAGWLINNV